MRRSLLLFFTCIMFMNSVIAQQKAITDNGSEVILYDDGTWKYTTQLNTEESSAKMNPAVFTRDKAASFLLKSGKIHMGFWLDPQKWKFYKAVDNEDAEFQMEQRGQSTQVVIIAEKVQIPLESLRSIVVTNLKKASPDLQITHEEYRVVNGLKVLYLQAKGTISGIKSSFYNYYYSDSSCTLQYDVIGFNADTAEDKRNAEQLLNGLVALPGTGNDSATGKKDDGNDAALSQGSLSPNNDCKKYFAGKWTYSTRDTTVIVDRTLQTTTESYGNNTYEYDNKWVNNCEYQVIFRKTSEPNYTKEKPGEVMLVDIMQIDDKTMRYNVSFRGLNFDGEMTKVTTGK